MRRSPVFSSLASVFLSLIASLIVAGCGGTNDTRSQSWAYISTAIIQPNCATANCHSAIAERSGVVLDTIPHGYSALVCRHWVVPSSSASSGLITLLRGQGTRRMPPDFALPDDDITLITRWIDQGGAAYSGPDNVVCNP